MHSLCFSTTLLVLTDALQYSSNDSNRNKKKVIIAAASKPHRLPACIFFYLWFCT